MSALAVTFDYGQTLAELDVAFLEGRVAEQGAEVSAERLAAEMSAAWDAYNDAKRRGLEGEAAWTTFMRALLSRSDLRPATRLDELVDFLWRAQPSRNLWRRPIPGMFELCEDLSRSGVPLGIVSNSEGRLADLIAELGRQDLFPVVADSGRLGFEKPDPRIFQFTAERLGVATSALVHVGDAWQADVEGALAVGARAIWISAEPAAREMPEGVVRCFGADEVRSALRAFGIPA